MEKLKTLFIERIREGAYVFLSVNRMQRIVSYVQDLETENERLRAQIDSE